MQWEEISTKVLFCPLEWSVGSKPVNAAPLMVSISRGMMVAVGGEGLSAFSCLRPPDYVGKELDS